MIGKYALEENHLGFSDHFYGSRYVRHHQWDYDSRIDSDWWVVMPPASRAEKRCPTPPEDAYPWGSEVAYRYPADHYPADHSPDIKGSYPKHPNWSRELLQLSVAAKLRKPKFAGTAHGSLSPTVSTASMPHSKISKDSFSVESVTSDNSVESALSGSFERDCLEHVLRDQHKKTELCYYWQMGICRHDHNCSFAHGVSQLRTKPDLSKTSWCDSLRKKIPCPRGDACTFCHTEDEFRDTLGFLTERPCLFFPRGHCRYGARCRFSHGKDYVRRDGFQTKRFAARPEAEDLFCEPVQ